jgi:uncharacterized phage protein gp47/JayE
MDYTTLDGIVTPIRFSRPTYIAVDVTVTVRQGTGYTADLLTAIQSAIESYILSLSIGDDVLVTGILTAIASCVANPKQPAFLLSSVMLGEAGETQSITDVAIPWNAVADVGTVSVTEVT